MVPDLIRFSRKGLGKVGRFVCPLEGDALCSEARQKTGLHEFGEPALNPALATLIASLENEANLHPLGRFLIRGHLRHLLENRLRLTHAWRNEPGEIANGPIRYPLFVVGMPRSGSTFLHELLAEDPNNRAPRVWEVMFPVALGKGGRNDQRDRIRKTEICLWWFRRFAPEADSVYPVRAWTPHECVAIHSGTFMSEEFIATCHVPTYQKFLRAADLVPAYIWEKRFLQYLQLGGPPKRWVLKSPDHVFGLDELFSVFPDAVIVQTHRNPLDVLRSIAHLTRVLHDLYAWAEPRHTAVLREARALAEATERFIAFRDRHPELAGRFIDLTYRELVADPLAAVDRIYQRLDCHLSVQATRRMTRLARERSRYRGHRRVHEPEALKLGASAESSRFKSYCSRFGLSYEPGM